MSSVKGKLPSSWYRKNLRLNCRLLVKLAVRTEAEVVPKRMGHDVTQKDCSYRWWLDMS